MLSEKVKNNFKEMNDSVLAVYNDENSIKEFLTHQLNFTNYSPMNRLYLWRQNPNCTYVASYNSWKKLGFPVTKKGCLHIFCPNMAKGFYDENNKWHYLTNATADEKEKIKNKTYVIKEKLTSYHRMPVFDVSSTSATEEDLVKIVSKKNNFSFQRTLEELYTGFSELLNEESNKDLYEERIYDLVHNYVYENVFDFPEEKIKNLVSEAVTFVVLNQLEIDNSLFKYKALSNVHWDMENINLLHKVNKYICKTSEDAIMYLASAF